MNVLDRYSIDRIWNLGCTEGAEKCHDKSKMSDERSTPPVAHWYWRDAGTCKTPGRKELTMSKRAAVPADYARTPDEIKK
jgi:hypothetical protein